MSNELVQGRSAITLTVPTRMQLTRLGSRVSARLFSSWTEKSAKLSRATFSTDNINLIVSSSNSPKMLEDTGSLERRPNGPEMGD